MVKNAHMSEVKVSSSKDGGQGAASHQRARMGSVEGAGGRALASFARLDRLDLGDQRFIGSEGCGSLSFLRARREGRRDCEGGERSEEAAAQGGPPGAGGSAAVAGGERRGLLRGTSWSRSVQQRLGRLDRRRPRCRCGARQRRPRTALPAAAAGGLGPAGGRR